MARVNDAEKESQKEGQMASVLRLCEDVGRAAGVVRAHYYAGEPWSIGSYSELKDALSSIIQDWTVLCCMSGINVDEMQRRAIAMENEF